MAEERSFAELGKRLAQLGLSFNEVSKRAEGIPEDNKRAIIMGFANEILNSKPDEAYRAAKGMNDELIIRSAAKKLVESNLRQSFRLASDLQDEYLMELVIQEAEEKKDAITAELMKRQLKEKKLKDIKEYLGK